MVYTLIVYYSFICLIINYSLLYLSIIAIESAKIHIFFLQHENYIPKSANKMPL